MNRRKLYYSISLFFALLISIVGTIYRNYIYTNSIFDYGFADMHTNIGAVLVASFLFMGYENSNVYSEEVKIILLSVVGFIIYEFIQLTPLIGTFDVKDIVGTIIGGIMTFGIHKIIYRK